VKRRVTKCGMRSVRIQSVVECTACQNLSGASSDFVPADCATATAESSAGCRSRHRGRVGTTQDLPKT